MTHPEWTPEQPFSLRHHLTPSRLHALLYAAAHRPGNINVAALESQLSVGVLKKVVLPFVRRLGLLDGWWLTEVGEQFYQLGQQAPHMLAEAVHHLLYTGHHFDPAKRFSWAYARVVDALWTSGERLLDGFGKALLVGMVVESAARAFDVPVAHIAFDCHSVRSVLNWLRGLDPPTVTKEGKRDLFRRRYFCPVPAFLWAVDFLYRKDRIAYGVRMFLTPERMEALCRVCVLDPSGLENVLMMARRTSDFDRGGIFDYGTEGGFGRWILLARPCPVPSLPEGG